MKAFSLMLRSALFCGVLLLAAPMAADAGPVDDALSKAVEKQLMSGATGFDATNISVSSKDGVVRLLGEVNNLDDVKAIEDAAMAVPGVKRIDNEISVTGNEGS